ncbi:MAG: hypothetical protein HY909_15525 [Deltaproteobacteria bacterium]|jgi:hypothetical protein|nr:hypothetical protein [Deltaproteobacteria bacterium]
MNRSLLRSLAVTLTAAVMATLLGGCIVTGRAQPAYYAPARTNAVVYTQPTVYSAPAPVVYSQPASATVIVR